MPLTEFNSASRRARPSRPCPRRQLGSPSRCRCRTKSIAIIRAHAVAQIELAAGNDYRTGEAVGRMKVTGAAADPEKLMPPEPPMPNCTAGTERCRGRLWAERDAIRLHAAGLDHDVLWVGDVDRSAGRDVRVAEDDLVSWRECTRGLAGIDPVVVGQQSAPVRIGRRRHARRIIDAGPSQTQRSHNDIDVPG